MLSIIIPTLNEEKYLPKLLGSIKKQYFKNYEIIVSDADSRDKTRSIAKKYGCKVVLNKKKKSPSVQRNNGAKKAKGDIFLFLDADTVLPDNFINSALEEFRKKKLDVAGFYLEFDNKKLKFRIASYIYNIFFRIARKIKPFAIGAAILVKAKAHRKAGAFDESVFIGEDHEYAERLSKTARFDLINLKMIYSSRRLEKEGVLKTIFKYIYCFFYVLIKGPIRKEIVKYEMGGSL